MENSENWQKDTLVKDTCCLAWQPNFQPGDLHGGKERTNSLKWSSDLHANTDLRASVYMHTVNK